MKHLLLFFLSSTIYFHVTAQQKETIQQFCFERLQYQLFSNDILLEIDDGTKYSTQSVFNKQLPGGEQCGVG